jgi:hypothetical protein
MATATRLGFVVRVQHSTVGFGVSEETPILVARRERTAMTVVETLSTTTVSLRPCIPYADGNFPAVGDCVIYVRASKLGVVTHLDLNPGNTPDHDQVSVEWDDGSVGASVSLAKEYTLVSRANK